MKHIKKVLILMLALMMVLGTVGAAHAAYDFNMTISSLTQSYNTSSKKITSVNSKWKLVLGSTNLSSVNIFGARLRKSDSSTTSVSAYHTYTKNGTYTHSYYSNANLKEGDSVFLRYKRDDSSTYAEPLTVYGTFEP